MSETKQFNLDNEMLNAFEHNNPLDVKHWIYKGADKQKLYDNVSHIDKLRDEECRYEVLIYETKEDYEQGEPFQENVYPDLDSAKNELKNIVKFNNYYAGRVEDQLTGEELDAFYSNNYLSDRETEERKILIKKYKKAEDIR